MVNFDTSAWQAVLDEAKVMDTFTEVVAAFKVANNLSRTFPVYVPAGAGPFPSTVPINTAPPGKPVKLEPVHIDTALVRSSDATRQSQERYLRVRVGGRFGSSSSSASSSSSSSSSSSLSSTITMTVDTPCTDNLILNANEVEVCIGGDVVDEAEEDDVLLGTILDVDWVHEDASVTLLSGVVVLQFGRAKRGSLWQHCFKVRLEDGPVWLPRTVGHAVTGREEHVPEREVPQEEGKRKRRRTRKAIGE